MSPLDDYGQALSGASVLVVDDEPGMRNFLAKTLGPRVKTVAEAGSAREATERLDEAQFDVIVVDNKMPGGSGIDWVREQRRKGLYAETVLITAYADLETAIAALRAGVSDFVLKPFRANQLIGAVARTLDRGALRRDNRLLRHALQAEGETRLLGRSAPMQAVRAMLEKLAPLPTPVLFTGATGTGKELAARTLHQMGGRAERPFVAVNCAAIAPDRIAAELFGEVEGDRLRPGLFLLADGGTLFLDEVAQMSETLQAALLRVIEDQRIRPLRAEREIPLDLRLTFATNTDLDKAVDDGRFRADLYHRINVLRIEMPPLSDRSEDIVELAALFIQHFSRALGLPELKLDDETLLKLSRYPWPGNVRELRNLVERSVILGSFPEDFAGSGSVTGVQAIENLDLVMQRHIMHVLELSGGNRAEAARRLGVSRKTVDRKVATWGE
ncbi:MULTISPECIES: sigma-54-dependent transcriptional regulator [Mameliella]|uniref:sigma-54-dependent transcriptional regulator n=1 Tax=Mameliella TaxID=1434019 RepID=UPI000841142F|nr:MULTISPECIES: sigma-54 dependent transcriptional regulator [Mameliella]MBV6635102.1 sigma-54-dependent Fis family transcriptional regulator [Mameliella sp.]MCR9275794.1 sigma-54 dependent transcriptional regulator [Paracoccaceae bacterium]ODM49690.1 sigma-54-dependent Fis family transcriptional regulator [Ruegeria sp. PBVC088]MBY6119925.1 sigma-54 dependent transcriptional regulator [Mameliella alba]MDD9733753.1 sigma-54 dependent transcriptional regulator [Mameliella sp. AT18]